MRGTWPSGVLTGILLFLCCSCTQTVDGVTPVGGDQPSEAELQRFMRRVHLDLAGTTPDEAYLTDSVTRLLADNSAATRAAIADELMAAEGFAETYVTELENRVFGGQTAETRYQQLCAIARVVIPECEQCPQEADLCASCDCPTIGFYVNERAGVINSASDLSGGTETSVLERRYANSFAFRTLFNDPNALAIGIFEVFLGRAAEFEEMDNAAAMINGTLIPDSPAGILFHRHGSSYEDLMDIVFESEIYREAVIIGAFERYLGRRPTVVELAHFTANLDTSSVDALAIVRAVVSSREYFEQ